jgi:uncharacterized membrane protein
MQQLPNPYAPPKFSAESDAQFMGVGLRREGDVVVIPVSGTRFPDRCVVCNQPATKRLSRKLYWHAPALYALIAISVPIYIIVGLIVRKKAETEIGLCEEHAKRRIRGYWIAWGGFVACFAGVIACIVEDVPAAALVLGLGMIVVLVVGLRMTLVVTPKRIDKQFAWLKVGTPFLESL